MKLGPKLVILSGVILIAWSIRACLQTTLTAPEIVVAPLGQKVGRWKVITSDTVNLIVTAPGAEKVILLYQPIDAGRSYAELKTLNAPTEGYEKFSLEWRPGPGFLGDLWAEAIYQGGEMKRTKTLSLASRAALTQGRAIRVDSIGNSVKTDESERSDKLTGGRIMQTPLLAGDQRIWVTVNIPAFSLTLWQNGNEVRTYQIGVGRADFPLPVGERLMTEIVWNPEWVPPNSNWVEQWGGVEIGERIEADDPRNPLGKVKIRLGEMVLIHSTAKRSDIGRLVSHGCVRMLEGDILDLADKIVAARMLPVSHERIERAKATTEYLAVGLNPPLWVDINYDTQVIEGGVLTLYPDVYNWGFNTREGLYAELTSSGIDPASLNEQALIYMLDRVSRKDVLRVSIAEIKAGQVPNGGWQPAPAYSSGH